MIHILYRCKSEYKVNNKKKKKKKKKKKQQQRSSTPFMRHIAKLKVLTYFIQHGGQFEIQISDILLNLKRVSMIVFNTIYICYKFQLLLILDIYLLSALL